MGRARAGGQPGRRQLLRGAALVLVLAVMPLALAAGSLLQDAPVRAGSPAPRTVVAPDLVRVGDPDATVRARAEAADAVEPVLVADDATVGAIVEQVRTAFADAGDVRRAGEAGDADGVPGGPAAPPELTAAEQAAALAGRLDALDAAGREQLVALEDGAFEDAAREAVGIAQAYARLAVTADEVAVVADRVLRTELAVRPVPDDVADGIVEPIVRAALRPTVREDPAATQRARDEAAGQVDEVQRTFARGTPIVRADEPVDEVALEALRSRGLEGADLGPSLLRALALAVLLTAAIAGYLHGHRPDLWDSGRSLALLALLVTVAAALLEAASLLPPGLRPTWAFAVPLGALVMLAAILVDPAAGVLVTAPMVVLALFVTPGEPAVGVWAALVGLASVPLVGRLSARGDLRRAAWRSTLSYGAAAGGATLLFGEPSAVGPAAAAGVVGGLVGALVVNGSLPFLESTFGICSATGLLDLADRNHPLLRELEQKAIGTYNHSVVVATMAERAAREINANALLASVAALYHDIGKVRRPYFFVENQFGIPNPHDELPPGTSAIIIQEHVTDGVEMAREYRLPPEVVEGIATHHGTTLVSYFHRQALAQAGDHDEVDEAHFRYKGRRPGSREMVVLMLADCCEGAARAAAQANRHLTGADLTEIVTALCRERLEDGQLDEAPITLRDLATVQRSFIETLSGVYHPRIAYPAKPGTEGAAATAAPAAASPPTTPAPATPRR